MDKHTPMSLANSNPTNKQVYWWHKHGYMCSYCSRFSKATVQTCNPCFSVCYLF